MAVAGGRAICVGRGICAAVRFVSKAFVLGGFPRGSRKKISRRSSIAPKNTKPTTRARPDRRTSALRRRRGFTGRHGPAKLHSFGVVEPSGEGRRHSQRRRHGAMRNRSCGRIVCGKRTSWSTFSCRSTICTNRPNGSSTSSARAAAATGREPAEGRHRSARPRDSAAAEVAAALSLDRGADYSAKASSGMRASSVAFVEERRTSSRVGRSRFGNGTSRRRARLGESRSRADRSRRSRPFDVGPANDAPRISAPANFALERFAPSKRAAGERAIAKVGVAQQALRARRDRRVHGRGNRCSAVRVRRSFST
jgi:hypothetical protein